MHITVRKAMLILLTLALGLTPVRYVLAAFAQPHSDHRAGVASQQVYPAERTQYTQDVTTAAAIDVIPHMEEGLNHCEEEYESCCLHCSIGLVESPVSCPVYQSILNSSLITYLCGWVSYPSFKPPRSLRS